MVSKIMEFHQSMKVLVFVKAREIINHENMYTVENIVKTIDELTEYEKVIKSLTWEGKSANKGYFMAMWDCNLKTAMLTKGNNYKIDIEKLRLQIISLLKDKEEKNGLYKAKRLFVRVAIRQDGDITGTLDRS